MNQTLGKALVLASLTLGGLISSGAQAQILKIVVPFAAGGSTDVVARILGEALAPKLGRPVIIENRTGAGAVVGTQAVAQAAPDGTTILFTTVSHAINPTLFDQLPYDSDRDFVAVAHVANVPLVLSVHPSVPANDLQEFLDYLRANPGKASYGSAGIGSVLHMSVELMKHQAKVDATHVPYRGAGPAMNDLIAGHIQFIIDPISTSAQHIKGKSIRALAVTSSQRSPVLPDVPTFKEAGLVDYEASTWNVILAPRGTPQEFVETLNQATNEVLAEPAVRKRFDAMEIIPVLNSTPASTSAFMAREAEKWSVIIKAAGVKLDR